MSNVTSIFRSLIIYAICLPLAIYLGYLLAMPANMSSLALIILALLLPLVPFLLRWHHLLLVFSWNASAVLFFLPGRPNLWLVMAAVSLTLTLLQHILNREVKLNYVPSVVYPLIFLVIVILITMKLTGGIGLRSFGGGAYGGKRYVLLLAGIAGFFAIAGQRISPSQRVLFVALFFLGGATYIIGNLGPVLDPSLYFIFAFFPVDSLQSLYPGDIGLDRLYIRLGGMSVGAVALAWFILARHGIRGLIDFGERWYLVPLRFRGGLSVNQPWRLPCFIALIVVGLLGGYRSTAILLLLLFLCQFYFEGLVRSHLFPVFLLVGVLMTAVCVPFTGKLPLQIQRAISFLPVDIDPIARYDAEASTEWRLRIWRSLLSEVPKYLVLGKGYAIDPGEMQMATSYSFTRGSEADEGAIVVGDYHNGPLSVIIPLGIWGMVGFLWFLGASLRVLYRNCQHGDAELRQINVFLLSFFLTHAIFFFTIFGSFYSELFLFTGIIGFSISLNGGVRGAAPVVEPTPTFDHFRLARAAR